MAKNRIKPSSRRPVSSHPNMYQNGKVRRDTNGKKTAVRTMIGISKADRIAIPDLRIGREWYFKFDHSYVDLYFVNGAVRIRSDIPSVKVRLGRMVDGSWVMTQDLDHAAWMAIAARMWPKSQHSDIQRVFDAVGSAILRHYQERYPSALPHILAKR